jgi:mono/diheme cytochrome c family protein
LPQLLPGKLRQLKLSGWNAARKPPVKRRHRMSRTYRANQTYRANRTRRVNQTWLVVWTILLAAAVSQGEPRDEPAGGSVYTQIVKPFIAQHCLSCHGPETAKAGYRIDLLGADFAANNAAEQWKEVLDRINAGEMPPPERPRPNVAKVTALTTWVNEGLREIDLAAKNAGGRIPMRRLNRDEYSNTVRDLLRLDELIVRPLTEELPADGLAEGFDRLGVALFFDQTQIERSLSVATKLAARAIVTEQPKINRTETRFELLRIRPPPEQVPVFPGFEHTIPRGAKDKIVHPTHIEHIQGGPTYRREYDGWGVVAHFAIGKVVTQDGYYRFRIKAKVDDRARTTTNKLRLRYALNSPIQVEEEFTLDPSGMTEAVLFLRGPVNGEVKGPQVFNMLWNHTEKAVIREPEYVKLFSQWTRLRGLLERAATNRAPQAEVDGLKQERAVVETKLNAWTGVANIYNPDMDLEKLPRLLLESIVIEGPIQQEWPPVSHKTLLFSGDERRDDAYVREVFTRFLPRAYRRPVTDKEIDSVVSVVNNELSTNEVSFQQAMRVGLQRVLCAPGFLFIEEPSGDNAKPRPLNEFELACRLSYFLWSTMPDDKLLELAASGKLHDPDVVTAQVRRMLIDPKSDQLVKNFAGQWLSVRDYGSIKPAAEYRDYDPPLEQASQQEPFAFFAEVLHKNLPITSFIDSDFLVINERLARHYGIAGVTGAEFRRVSIRPEDHRGGVLGMAGLMTYLADGTRTLPMRRGTWVLRELLNDPPNNPPPNAGEIQPNTAGKNLTVRQRLELHRHDDVCASCHQKLDAYGLALENYDAIGAWRERFNGEGFRGSNAPELDVSGVFPNGHSFVTLEEYKAGLMQQKEKFARALSVKMLTYALGRPVGYTDNDLIQSLVDQLQQDDYRIHSLIHAIVASTAFNTK